MPGPLDEKKIKTLPSLRVPESLELAIMRHAARLDRSISYIQRLALVQYLQREVGDENLEADSTFGKLDGAVQCDARIKAVK